MALVVLGFAATGAFIFYNTNVLNEYQTSKDTKREQVDYERKYKQTPTFSSSGPLLHSRAGAAYARAHSGPIATPQRMPGGVPSPATIPVPSYLLA
jgi:hypothetical protein